MKKQIKEHWRKCPYDSNYSVSNLGRIRRDTRKSGTHPGKIVKTVKVGNYFYISFVGPYGIRRRIPVHRLVLETFKGVALKGYEADHKDKNTTNNNINNLQWLLIKENRSHLGSKNGSAKLDEMKVLVIKIILSANVVGKNKPITYSALASMFGVHRRTIRRIKEGEKWKHVKI